MGLLKTIGNAVSGVVSNVGGAAGSAISSVVSDQYREYFYCDAFSDDVLMSKGRKRETKRGNNNGADNIISNGSIIAVNEGQFMMIVDQGQVVEFSGEPGEFVWDASTEPSFFYGKFKDNIGKTAGEIWKRFTFGGEIPKDQRVYFFNAKHISNNLFGTASPIPFRVVDNKLGLDLDTSIRCNGSYVFQIEDPILFYKNVCANVTDKYTRDMIIDQMKSEFISALQPALSRISALGIRYNEVPAHVTELTNALREELTAQWNNLRGINVVTVAINALKLSEEDEKMIKELQRTAVFQSASMGAASLVSAQSQAMVDAANNENGAMMAFAGLNMAQNAGGMNAASLYQMAGQQQQQAAAQQPAPQAPAADSRTCGKCGTVNNGGKFCSNCGESKPADGWVCTKCGNVNKGKFCANCGTPKPAGEPLYKCDKCGWEPEDPKNPPKFCPQCGDPFTDEDQK